MLVLGATLPQISPVLPWLLFAAVVIATWRFLEKGGGGTAIASLETANRVLERRVQELEEQDKAKSKRIAELETRTDVAIAILPVLDGLREHDEAATKRDEMMLVLLQLIADRLGPDGERGVPLA